MKKALCVGINAYRVKPLNGCVNDANGWAELLIGHFDLPRANVVMLTDAQATRGAILTELKGLLAGSRAGDVLVFTNSSHGTQILDRGDGDESIDEAICPIDYDSGLLVDDDLRELFSGLPEGVALSVISDSCHSGSVTRDLEEPNYPPAYSSRERWLDWEFLPAELRPTAAAVSKGAERYPESGMREVLLAGCRDTESSYDARLGADFHGAMTHHALEAIRAANYRISYEALAGRLTQLFSQSQFAPVQHPQLEGRPENKARQIFS
jgi:metacaspase-1